MYILTRGTAKATANTETRIRATFEKRIFSSVVDYLFESLRCLESKGGLCLSKFIFMFQLFKVTAEKGGYTDKDSKLAGAWSFFLTLRPDLFFFFHLKFLLTSYLR